MTYYELILQSTVSLLYIIIISIIVLLKILFYNLYTAHDIYNHCLNLDLRNTFQFDNEKNALQFQRPFPLSAAYTKRVCLRWQMCNGPHI